VVGRGADRPNSTSSVEEAKGRDCHEFRAWAVLPEYVIDTDGHPGGSGIDLMNAVAKRAGLSVGSE
jgi:hypothetical protein